MDDIIDSDITLNILHHNDDNDNSSNNEGQAANLNTVESLNNNNNLGNSDSKLNILHHNDDSDNSSNNEGQAANLNTVESLNNNNNLEAINKTISDESVLQIIDDKIFDVNDAIVTQPSNVENPMIDDISNQYEQTILESTLSLDDTEKVYNKTFSQIEEEDKSIQLYRDNLKSSESGNSITDYTLNETSTNLNKGAKLDIIELCYSVVINNKLKKILKNVSFSLLPGTLCALMGPSSAGKSTLLDIVADRKLTGTWSGNILIDDKPRSHTLSKEIAYVLQDDEHIAALTVEETLQYAAWTRLEEGISLEMRQKRVIEVLTMMGLIEVRDKLVGTKSNRVISDGHVKCLSIAIEIIADRKLIFLDDPTRALDSPIASQLIRNVRQLTQQGHTCLATVNQPSREVFSHFDKMVLITYGRVIFFGKPNDGIEYFTNNELGYKYGASEENFLQNPAEFFIEISSGKILPIGSTKPRQAEELDILFTSSMYCSALTIRKRAKIDETIKPEKYKGFMYFIEGLNPYLVRSDSLYTTSKVTQIKMLLHRTWISKLRDTTEIKVSFLKSIGIAILFGMLWYKKAEIDSPLYHYAAMKDGVVTLSNFLFVLVIFLVFDNVVAISDLFKMMVLYRRELASSAYSPFPFILSIILVFPLIQFIYHLIFIIIIFYMVKFKSDSGYFFYFLFITFLGRMGSYASALALAANLSDQNAALVIFPVTFLIQAIFTGCAIHIGNIPKALQWITTISITRYTYEGLMVNQWSRYGTDDGDDVFSENSDGDILEDFSFDNFNKNDAVWIGMLFFFIFIAILGLGLRPASNELIEVEDATDVVTVFSKTSRMSITSLSQVSFTGGGNVGGLGRLSFAGGSLSHTASFTALSGRLGANDKASGRKKGNSLFQNLLPDSDKNQNDDEDEDNKYFADEEQGDFTDSLVMKEQAIEHEQRKGVEFYRLSTGTTTASKGCSLLFHNVEYTSPSYNNDKTKDISILKGVSGYVNPSEMCALLGSNGAGKTTLLNVLANRVKNGIIQGKITYNGHSEIRTSFAYVQVDNIHMHDLTVRETIYYAAQLRLDENIPEDKKNKRVSKILSMLGLSDVSKSLIGNKKKRGISEGQLKCVSIGVEIINFPDLMFLDEPTTGLDSSTSFEILSAIRNLANQNRSILCTIRHPSEETFSLFDTVLFLAEGREIYFGPALDMIEYFTKSPFRFEYDLGMNPVDFVIAVSTSFIPASDGRMISCGELFTYYRTTLNYQTVIEVLEPNSTTKRAKRRSSVEILMSANPLLKAPKEDNDRNISNFNKMNSFQHQMKTLLSRRVLSLRKDPLPIIGGIVRVLFMSILYGGIFWKDDVNIQGHTYQDTTSILLFALIDQVICHISTIALLFNERSLYYREKNAITYTSLAYWISIWVPQAVVSLPLTLLYSIILYNMSGLRSSSSKYFGIYFSVLLITNYIGIFSSILSASVATSIELALAIYIVFLFTSIIYAGGLIYPTEMDHWQRDWIPFLDFLRYGFQALVLNQFDNNSDYPGGSSLISDTFAFDTITLHGCIGILIIFLFSFAILSYLALRYINYD